MKQSNDSKAWIAIGIFGAFAVGALLIPLRGHVSASNLAFVFLALTIVVAELGGRGAAIVTALMSAASLNFFLTQPYLSLSIDKQEDMIALVALVVCALIAAAFGKRRQRWEEIAGRAAQEIDILKSLVEKLRNGTSLNTILGELKTNFRLEAIVLRDPQGGILASPPNHYPQAAPTTALTPDALFPLNEESYRLGERGFRLPEGGGRLSINTDHGPVSIDLWEGDEQGLSIDERQTLAIAALILVHELSCRERKK